MDFREFERFPLILRKSQRKSFRRRNNQLKRFINKSGNLNIQLQQVPYHKYLQYTKDFANTLVSVRWRWLIMFVALAHAFFYSLFGGLWMLDAYLSGDFNSTKKDNFCISRTRAYTGYLLLSIETITTTGYGYLYPTEYCQMVYLNLTLSTIVMIMLDGAFISIIYLKFSKPEKRHSLNLFSRKAVICLRNGKLCLIMRIYDRLNKHLIEPMVNLYYIDNTQIKEENSVINLEEIEIKTVGVLLWPTDIVHEINESSPLFNLAASDLLGCKFEIVVAISGISLVTSQNSISKSSYLNDEILWGYRFKNCVDFDEKKKQYKINEDNVFRVNPCDTPLCSAQKLKEIREELVRPRVPIVL